MILFFKEKQNILITLYVFVFQNSVPFHYYDHFYFWSLSAKEKNIFNKLIFFKKKKINKEKINVSCNTHVK
jgi:hypothetical protein